MSSLNRKIRRKLIAAGKAKPLPEKLWAFNNSLHLRIKNNPAIKRYAQLHATKGWQYHSKGIGAA